MLHPWVRVAIIVVSDIKERLSPKNAPPTTAATIITTDSPARSAKPSATGTKATMVPTEVPIDSEIKQAAKNSPAKIKCGGNRWSAKLTVASTAPIARADSVKAPASTNIQIIISRSRCVAPRRKRRTFVLPRNPGTATRA